MQKNHYGLLILLTAIIIGCSSSRQKPKAQNQTEPDLNSWQAKDYALDGIPGISLDKAYKEKLIPKTAESIIVAVLDTKIELNHEDLKGQLWVNENEISGNKIDDDHNGYIDDVNGWNFTSKKNGDTFISGNFECTRMVRKWEDYFKTKDTTKLSVDDAYNFKEYKRAISYQEYYIGFYENWRKSLVFNIEVFQPSKDALKKFFPKEDYTMKDLDSLYQIHKINDKPYWQRRDDNDRDLGALIYYMIVSKETNVNGLEDIINRKIELDSTLQRNLNVKFNERDYINENQQAFEKGYGSNHVSSANNYQKHSTEVSGIIAANRNNKIGIQGFSNNIKIMPVSLCISADEYDKDIAMAIYYAVDNGAKIINMSFAKEFSLEQQLVTAAMKYAEQRNVLLVNAAGNNRMDIDTNPTFPNDYSYKDKTQMVSNLITVGATTHTADSTLVHATSSYGKKNVDLFAPGRNIYTLMKDNKYDYDSGTSLAAPMVSGTAALIWLKYPKLTVQEVKQIILDSGMSYDIEVLIPGTEGKKAPFKELSKSGKILNVYNALKMAEEKYNDNQRK